MEAGAAGFGTACRTVRKEQGGRRLHPFSVGAEKRTRNRILLAIALFVVVYVVAELLPLSTWLGSETAALWAEFALFLVPYLIAGYDVLLRAAKNIGHGQVFDENFLMSVATIGAFALVLFPDSDPHMAEGAAVMLFYQDRKSVV